MTMQPQPLFSPRTADERFLKTVYQRLFKEYGKQHWWPAETDLEMIIGAILTQSTSWTNVEKAIHELQQKGMLSVQGLYDVPLDTLAEMVHSSGYFNQKAKKIKAFIQHLMFHHQGKLDRLLKQPLPSLRQELQSIHGVGKETADSIILYASRQPVFVIDAYTRRIFNRLGCNTEDAGYDELQEMFHHALPADVPLFNEYHALIVAFGKSHCRKRPDCPPCILKEYCWYWKTQEK